MWNNERKEMLRRLMALDFAALELNLYLDTHPQDGRALQDFNAVAQQAHVLRQQYQERFGPLINFGHSFSKLPWQWIQEPWPWEITF
ncbi:MAG: spore coat protein CotJB [bacterium]|jgi:spore coat protein JB